jgi:hypothetical protein
MSQGVFETSLLQLAVGLGATFASPLASEPWLERHEFWYSAYLKIDQAMFFLSSSS